MKGCMRLVGGVLLSCFFAMCWTEDMQFNTKLIIDYFRMKNLFIIISFLDWTQYRKIRFSDDAMKYGIRVVHMDWRYYSRSTFFDNEGIKRVLTLDNSNIGIVTEENNQFEYKQLFVEMAKNNYMNSSYCWLILSEQINKSLAIMEDLSLHIDTDVTITSEENHLSHIELFDVYNPGQTRGSKLVVRSCGFWSKEESNLSYTCTEWYRPANGLLVRPVAVIIPGSNQSDLHQYLTDRNEPYVDGMAKFSYDVLLFMKDYYNLTIEFVRTTSWGDPGIVSVMRDGTADITAASLRILLERVDSLDTVYQSYEFRTGFIFLNPQTQSGIESIFLAPFTSNAWILMAVTVSLGSVLLTVACQVEENISGSFPSALLSASLAALGSVCQQGSDLVPTRISGRMIVITMLMFTTVLYNFYTSSIVSSLLNNKADYIKSLKDLANSNLKIGIEDIKYSRIEFETAPRKEVKYLIEKKTKQQHVDVSGFYLNIKDGVAEVQKGTMAYHAEITKLYPLIAESFDGRQICFLREIPIIKKSKLIVASSKNSPYKNMFRVGALKWAQSGLLARSRDLYQMKSLACHASIEVEPAAGGQTAPALLLLLAGGVLAIVILLAEIRGHRKLTKFR